MPPQQCPECGRFLKNAFVVDLASQPAACPGCDVELTATMFEDADGPPPPPAEALAAATDARASAGTGVRDLADASVRPPDLVPEDVRDDPDPLAGWDVGAPQVGLPVVDRRPFPTDTVVIAGAGALGLAAGLLAGRRRGRDAAVGALIGVVVAGVARRIWQAP